MSLVKSIRSSQEGAPREMSASTFQQFREIVYEQCGIVLADNKQPLVKGRVQRRMRELRINDYQDYIRFVLDDKSNRELQELIDAISTNVTSFYREAHHFECMREVIHKRIAQGHRKIRVWSAACSTGEEPYTIAIEILEAAGRSTIDARILATDISSDVLDQCRAGIYPMSKLKPVPPALLKKYFTAREQQHEVKFEAAEKLRRMLSIRRFNLSSFPFSIGGPIDFIFCRNVMIYFDRPMRAKIINEFERIVSPGGYLFVGHSESLSGMVSQFTCVRPSIYRRD